jgi:hypothetical protein
MEASERRTASFDAQDHVRPPPGNHASLQAAPALRPAVRHRLLHRRALPSDVLLRAGFGPSGRAHPSPSRLRRLGAATTAGGGGGQESSVRGGCLARVWASGVARAYDPGGKGTFIM